MSALKIFDGGDAPPPNAPQERPEINGFAAIPHAFCASSVTNLGYRVFGAILSFTRGADTTTVTDSAIAGMIGVGRQAVSKAVMELVELGWLSKRSAGPLRTLTINPSPPGSSVALRRHKPPDDGPASVAVGRPLCRPQATLVSPTSDPCVAVGRHLLRREENTSEKGRASSGEPRGGAPPTPVKKGAPPQRSAPPPPVPVPPIHVRRAPGADEHADAILDPGSLVMLEALAGGSTEGRALARVALANHNRAVAYFRERGEQPPERGPDETAEMRGYLAKLKLPLPVDFAEMPTGDARLEKNASPGSLGKDAPGPAWTDHP